jgi:hypothetical protein
MEKYGKIATDFMQYLVFCISHFFFGEIFMKNPGLRRDLSGSKIIIFGNFVNEKSFLKICKIKFRIFFGCF